MNYFRVIALFLTVVAVSSVSSLQSKIQTALIHNERYVSVLPSTETCSSMKDMAHIGRSQDESSLPELKDFVERKIRERIGIQITVLDTAARKKEIHQANEPKSEMKYEQKIIMLLKEEYLLMI